MTDPNPAIHDAVATPQQSSTVEDELRSRLGRLSLEQKVRLLTGADMWSLYPEPSIGLRRLVVSDGPAGIRGERWDGRDPSANIPSPTSLAATWDTDRVERIGGLLAGEARRKHVDVLLAPTVNLHRSPYGGRHFEGYSEDPLLTASIGAAYVRGLQSHGVGACVKHFVANDSETDRMTLDARVGERTLRELYLVPFETIVQREGVWSVMAAYNGVNGATMTESPLLREILHDDWGFDGVTMSDWWATRSTTASARAALDLAMPGPHSPWSADLLEQVRDGTVAQALIDDKVLRILRLAARVGALDGIPPERPEAVPLADRAVATQLREAAAAGFVLARNDGAVLPLDRAALRRVAVIGPNAAVARTLGGGSATVFPPYTVSPLDGLRAALGAGVEISHQIGVRPYERVPIADADQLRQPDGGAPGIEVRFVGPDGSVLGSELHTMAHFTWLGTFVPGVPLDAVERVEMRTRLHAVEAGSYTIGCSGLGEFRMELDGAVAFDCFINVPAGEKPEDAWAKPPQRAHAVELAAGTEVDVLVVHTVNHAGFGTGFQFNVEPPHLDAGTELADAVRAAGEADVAIVVVGTTQEVESEGFDRDSLALPGTQDDLVRRIVAANPRTVVVVNSGAPVLLPWQGEVPAVLLSWFPGQEFGHALADVLLGDAEPGGRLPTTWPATEDDLLPVRPVDGVLEYQEGVHIGHRRFAKSGVEPLYWFGHGLGYTTWEYRDAGAEATGDGGADVTVRIRNTGGRRGREVVQVYAAVSGGDSDQARPVRWLVGFATVEADPGEQVTVPVHVPARAFSTWDVAAHRWILRSGRYRLTAARSADPTTGCTAEVDIQSP